MLWNFFNALVFSSGFAAGGALVWYGKDKIQALVIGAHTLSARLHAQADAISAAAKKL